MKRNKHFPGTALCCILSFLCVLFLQGSAGKAYAAEMDCVSYTAYTSLYWLKEAGVPEAKEFAKAVGKNVSFDKASVKDYNLIAPVNRLYYELEYRALNEYIRTEGYQNVLDVGCGYSPRALLMARQGKHNTGAELDAIALSLPALYAKCLTENQQKLAASEIVDATNPRNLLQAADRFQGRICITMDGLMMYLSRREQALALQNIRKALKKHGGVFITLDFSSRDILNGASQVIYGDGDHQEIYHESTKTNEQLAGTAFDSTGFRNAGDAENFLKAQGLKARRVPLFSSAVKLSSTGNFTPEQESRLEALKQEPFLWVITAE